MIKKVLKYVIIYMLVTVVSAVGVIYYDTVLNSSEASGEAIAPKVVLHNIDEIPDDETASTLIMESVMNTAMSLEFLGLDVNATITVGEEEIAVLGQVDLNLELATNEISLQGDLEISAIDNDIPVSVKYTDGVIYLTCYESGFYVSTDDLTAVINAVLNLLGKTETLDENSEEGGIDISSLLDTMNDLTVERNGESAFVTLPLGDLGDAVIILDYDLNIVGAKLDGLSLGGATISADIGLTKYESKTEISAPNVAAYCDLGVLPDLITSVKPILADKAVNADAAIKINGKTLNLNAKVDFSSALSAEVKLINSTKYLKADLLEDTLYFDYESLRFMAKMPEEQEIRELLDSPLFTLIKDKFGVDVKTKVSNLLYGEIDLKNVVEAVASLRKYDKTYSLSGFGIVAEITTNGAKLSNVGVYTAGITAAVTVKDNAYFAINPAKIGRVDLKAVTPLLDVAYNTVKDYNLNGEIALSYEINGEPVTAAFNLDFADKLALDLSAEIMELDAQAALRDGEIFLNVENKDFLFDLDDIDQVLTLLKDSLGLNLNTESIDALSVISKINYLSVSDNAIRFAIGDASVTLNYTDKINSIVLSYKGLVARADLRGVKSDLNEVDLTLERDDLTTYIPFAKAAINSLKEGAVSLTGDLNAEIADNDLEVPLIVKANFKDGITLNAAAEIYGVDLAAVLCDNSFYLDALNNKFVLPLSELDGVIEWVNSTFDKEISLEGLNLKEIINNISISAAENSFDLTYDDLSVNLSFGNKLTVATVNYKDAVSLSATIDATPKLPTAVSNAESYQTYALVTDLVGAVVNSIQNDCLSGSIDLNYASEKLPIEAELNYKVTFVDGEPLAEITTDFYGVNAAVYYQDQTVLLNAAGLKVKLLLSEIEDLVEWINTTFDKEIVLSEVDSSTIGDLIDKVTLTFSEGNLVVNYDNKITINLKYDEKLQTVEVTASDLTLTLGVSDELIRIRTESAEDYNSYSVVTDFVESAKETLNYRLITAIANADVYEGISEISEKRFDVDIDMELDLRAIDQKDEEGNVDISQIAAYGHADVSGESEHELTAYFDNEYLYVDYLGLKLSCNINNLGEIAVIAMKALGVNTDGIPFLNEIAEGMEINADNLTSVMPSINLDNPLTMLRFIEGVRLYEDYLEITFNGEEITPILKEEITAKVYFNENGFNRVTLTNIYTGVNDTENFDLDLMVSSAESVRGVTEETSYIDISDVSELLKAFVNTSELTDYAISATANVRAEIIGIPINMSVPLNAKVKLYEDKSVTVDLSLGEIPVIVGVNNDVPYVTGDTNGGQSRYLRVYYKDGAFYLYRSEYVGVFLSSPRLYQKKTSVSTDGMLDQILYYLCDYGIGLSDSIMSAVNDAVTKERANPIDFANIVKGYRLNKSSGAHEITLNMAEIAGDDKLGLMTLNIYATNVNDEKYLTKATFSLDMPLASAVSLTISTNDLTLDNVGSAVNVSDAESYVNSYSYKQEEEWESPKNNSNWKRTKFKEYTIKFNENGGANVSDITSAAGDAISLPTYADRNADEDGYRNTYRFDGWYKTATFREDSKFTDSVMPRPEEGTETNVYAKWTRIKHLKYVTFNYYGGVGGASGNSTVLEESQTPTLTEYTTFAEDKDGYHDVYEFGGWYTTDYYGFGDEYAPFAATTEDVNVYAKWTRIKHLKYVTFNYYGGIGGASGSSTVLEENQTPTLTEYTTFEEDKDGYHDVYEFNGWYLDEQFRLGSEYAPFAATAENVNVYAKWTRIKHLKYVTFTAVYNNGEANYVETVLESNDLPEIAAPLDSVTDDGISVKSYTFGGWYLQEDFNEDSAYVGGKVGAADVTIYAKRNLTETFYRNVTFDMGVGEARSAQKLLEGEDIALDALSNVEITEGYATTTYAFDGWYVGEREIGAQYTAVDKDETITAKWRVVKVEETRAFVVKHGADVLYSGRKVVGEAIDLPENALIREDTKYYTDSSYSSEITIGTMPRNDLTVYVRNKYTLNYSSDYDTSKCVSVTAYEGEAVTYPSLSVATFDDGNTERREYAFNGWYTDANKTIKATSSVMPSGNATYYAKWTVTVKKYYTVTINYKTSFKYLLVNQTPYEYSKGQTITFKALEGSTVNLSGYAATGKFRYGLRYNCKTTGFTVNGSKVSSFTVTGNTTANAVWTKS